MNIALIHYGSDPKYLRLLERWIQFYNHSGCKLNVTLVTDLLTDIPNLFQPYRSHGFVTDRFSYLRFNPLDMHSILREGRPFDIKGSLICQALQILPECMFVDTDAFFVSDPTEVIAMLPKYGCIGIGDDKAKRAIRIDDEDNINPVYEDNAGVLYFGASTPRLRTDISHLYQSSFNMLKHKNDSALLEQITWTIIARMLVDSTAYTSFRLPRILNWSYCWGRSKDVLSENNAKIVHEHGPKKWKELIPLHFEFHKGVYGL